MYCLINFEIACNYSYRAYVIVIFVVSLELDKVLFVSESVLANCLLGTVY